MSVICRTRLKDVDISKTQPSKYFVYMYWENPTKTEYRTTLTATYSHTFWLQSFGRSHKSLANAKNFVTVPFYFEFEGNFRVPFLRFSKTIFVNIDWIPCEQWFLQTGRCATNGEKPPRHKTTIIQIQSISSVISQSFSSCLRYKE